MKKLLKLTLIILLAIVVLFGVAGCGNKKEENEKEETKAETEEISNGKSKTYNVFSKIKDSYLITLEGKTENEKNETLTMALKGKNMYMDTKSEGEHATMIYKDGTIYIISHDEKAYIVMPGDENEMDGMTLISEDDISEMEEAEYKTGKETIDGVEYDYEEYADEEAQERYYFLGTELKYVKTTYKEDGEVELLKVVEITSNVDDKLFEIPADYTKVEF